MEDQAAAIPVSAASARDAAAGPSKTCPSSCCGEGALLLGVMTTSRRLAYLNPPVPVDAEFAAREAGRGNPERRYRFAGPCLEGGCPQWTGRGCAIADMAAGPANLGLPTSPRKLPACGIRRSCRWYFQRGPAACAVCPLIVADMGGTDTYQSVKAEAYGHHLDTQQSPPPGSSAQGGDERRPPMMAMKRRSSRTRDPGWPGKEEQDGRSAT